MVLETYALATDRNVAILNGVGAPWRAESDGAGEREESGGSTVFSQDFKEFIGSWNSEKG